MMNLLGEIQKILWSSVMKTLIIIFGFVYYAYAQFSLGGMEITVKPTFVLDPDFPSQYTGAMHPSMGAFHVWVQVSIDNTVWWRPIHGPGWTQLDGSMKNMDAGNQTLWGWDETTGEIFIRLGISANSAGDAWVPVESPPAPSVIKHLSVSDVDDSVWAMDWDGNIFRRTGITESSLQGDGWEAIASPPDPCASINIGGAGVYCSINDWTSGNPTRIYRRDGTSGAEAGTGWTLLMNQLGVCGEYLVGVAFISPNIQIWESAGTQPTQEEMWNQVVLDSVASWFLVACNSAGKIAVISKTPKQVYAPDPAEPAAVAATTPTTTTAPPTTTTAPPTTTIKATSASATAAPPAKKWEKGFQTAKQGSSFLGNFLGAFDLASELDCAIQCARNRDCNSFTVQDGTNTCKLFSDEFDENKTTPSADHTVWKRNH